MEKILLIILSIFPFLIGALIGMVKRDCFHPAALILYFWGAFLLASMVFLWSVNFSILTLLYFFVALLLYGISAFFFPSYVKYRSVKRVINLRLLKAVCLIAPMISIVFSVILIADSGIDLNKILKEFSSAAGEFATMRGTTGVSYGLVGVISIGLAYFSSWAAGLLMIVSKNDKVYVYSAITPIFFIMLVQSAKLILFVGFAMFISGLMVGRIFSRSDNIGFLYFFNRKNIFIVVVVMVIVAFSFTTRDGYGDSSNMEELFDLLKYLISSYLFGPIYAFDDFFKFTIGMPSASGYRDDYNSGGVYTFYSLFLIFGYEKQFPIGTYDETGFVDGVYETNIFTAFRGLIYDFGVVGSLFVLMLVGFIFNYFYYVGRRDLGPLKLAIASISVPFGFVIYLISPFMANYLFLQILMIFIFLKISTKKFN